MKPFCFTEEEIRLQIRLLQMLSSGDNGLRLEPCDVPISELVEARSRKRWQIQDFAAALPRAIKQANDLLRVEVGGALLAEMLSGEFYAICLYAPFFVIGEGADGWLEQLSLYEARWEAASEYRDHRDSEAVKSDLRLSLATLQALPPLIERYEPLAAGLERIVHFSALGSELFRAEVAPLQLQAELVAKSTGKADFDVAVENLLTFITPDVTVAAGVVNWLNVVYRPGKRTVFLAQYASELAWVKRDLRGDIENLRLFSLVLELLKPGKFSGLRLGLEHLQRRFEEIASELDAL